jgi:DNA-binding transcriptional LysR family regulator
LRLALELPSNEALRAAVEAGLGATVISASVAAPSLEAGLLHRVRFNLPERHFQVVRHVARCRSRAADALLSMVRVRSCGVTDIPKLAPARTEGGHDRSTPQNTGSMGRDR